MSQSQPLSTNSMRLAAIRLTSANKHIFRALLSLASAALLTRMFGMLNQVIVTSHFGAGAAMDAYFVASALPTLMALLIGSAVESSVIPVYARIRSLGNKEQASRLFSTLLNILIVGAILLTVVMLIFSQQMILLSAPGLDPFRTGLANSLAPFIYPVLAPMVVIGFLECILNTEGQFGWPAYAGLLVPLTTAILVLVVGKSLGVVMLCVGMLVGLSLQLCVFIVRVRRAKIVYRPIIDLRNPEIGLILAAAWPVLIGSLIGQASPLVDQIFASFLTAGSISALNYSLKIISVFSGVIFASVGRAALPYLSRQAAIDDMKAFKATLHLYLWTVGIGTAMLSMLLFVLAHPLVQLLFQRGAFSAEDANQTATTLIGFTIGLTPMSLGFIMARAFSALSKAKVLMVVSTFSVIANTIFDYVFAHYWQSQGIALATSAVYFCTMFILFFTLRQMIGELHFFAPPGELIEATRRIAMGQYSRWVIWKEASGNFYGLRRQIVRFCIVMAVFAAGTIGVFLNSLYTLRLSLGSIIILALLRYRYALLIAWVLFTSVIASVPIFTDNNLLTGMTAPTLLLMVWLPVRQTFRHMPALAFLLLYLLWVFASIGISAIGIGSFLVLWFGLLDFFAAAMITIQVLTTQRRLMGLIDAILLGSTFISLYGIYGYFTKQHVILDSTEALRRITSIFGAAPTLALFLSIVIPLALYRTITLRGFQRVGGSIMVFIFLIALVMTFTRGAFISVPVSIIIMILFLPSRKMKIGLFSGFFGLIALTLLLTTLGNVPIFDRFFNSDITTLNGRTYLWQAVISHFDPTQILGKGLNASNVLLDYLQVRIFTQGVIATAPHSLFLGTLYDHGIIGVILLSLIFISLFASLIRGMRKTSGEHRMLFTTALGILVSVLLQSIDSNDIWILGIGIYFWIIMALPFALCWLTPKRIYGSNEELFDKMTEPRMEAIQQAGWEQVFQV